jgi:DNA-binding MarR family transcriptional regulator
LNSASSRKLQSFLNALDLFGDNPDMPLGMIAALVRVALNPGANGNALAERAGVVPGMKSRHLTDRGKMNRKWEEAHGLIEQITEKYDTRVKCPQLTSRGRSVGVALLELLCPFVA